MTTYDGGEHRLLDKAHHLTPAAKSSRMSVC